jgi:endonuclease I/methionine-rich copper-binding protein CopC
VVQFLSYEGTFAATNGPASGLTSTLIPQSESESTAVGHSLRLTGSGSSYSQFSWAAAAASSFGACNSGQTLTTGSGGGGGGGGGTVLSNGVPVSNLGAATNSSLSYTISVPAGASNLVIQTSGGSGDADLYVRFGSAPTTSTYDCRPYQSGNAETCTFATPQAGTWHVMVRGYTTFSGLTLTGSYSASSADSAPTLQSSTPASGASNVAVGANISLAFSEPVTLVSGWYTLTCSATGAHPLAVSGGPSSYTLNPTTDFGPSESCTLSILGANVRDQDGTVTPMATNAAIAFTTAAATGGGNVLSNGVPVSNLGAATNSALNYTISVPAGASNLLIQSSGGSGDADLYVRFGSAPTTSTYDCRPYLSGNAESCTFATPQAGTWHVMVRAYTTFSGLTLSGSFGTGSADSAPTLQSTTPATGASGVAANANINLVFSEPVTLLSGWSTLSCDATGAHPFAVTGGPSSYTLNPNVDFGPLETCTLSIVGANVRDQDGTVTPMAANATVSFTTIGAQTGYYASVVTSSASALRSSLHPVIDDSTKIPYTASTTDSWDVLNQADQDPLNTSRVLDIYKNASYAKASGGNNFYNREHTWPNSLGFPSDGATNYAYTDLHMLMISDISYNSSRGNKPYDNCPSGCTEFPTMVYNGQGGGTGAYPGNSNWGNNSVFQVWARLKGNVARAMFYMDLRYEGGTHGVSGAAEPDLRLTDNLSLVTTTGSNAAVGYMGKLSTLIQWHNEDPVDNAERLRNELIQTYQGNRNPFIDHPEWVACVYQSVCN